ncbi:MAG: DUF2007 domain-containing protein [Armatimonadetes bacterium]|nr:DUF2007 domain-containing protein [Armatimonadota bacterium]
MSESGEELVVVYQAPDQLTAYAAKSALEAGGIPAVLMDERSTWGGYATFAHPEFYANIAVPQAFLERALSLIDVYQSASIEPHAEIEDQEFYSKKHTVWGWKSGCVFMAVVSAALTALTWNVGFDRWQWILGSGYLIGGIWSPIDFLKTAPARFHVTIKIYTAAHFPIGVALVLASGTYMHWVQCPMSLFLDLGALSTVIFSYGAILKIHSV